MHGYTVAFWVAAGVFAIGAVVVGSLMHSIKIEADAPTEPTGKPQLARSCAEKARICRPFPFHRRDRFNSGSEQARNRACFGFVSVREPAREGACFGWRRRATEHYRLSGHETAF